MPVEQEVLAKIKLAREQVKDQTHRELRCPHCQKKTIKVFADATGHIQCKCKYCKEETIFNVLSFRRIGA